MIKPYYFKINGKIRGTQEHIMVSMTYKKGRGYVATAYPCDLSASSGMVSICLDCDTWGKYQEIVDDIYPCARDTAKAKAMSEARFSKEKASSLAVRFCEAVYQRCGETYSLAD